MQIEFCHGALCDDYEKQANEQGFTLGYKREFIQNISFGLIASHIHGILTDSEYNKALKRFNKYIVRSLIKLDGSVSNEKD